MAVDRLITLQSGDPPSWPTSSGPVVRKTILIAEDDEAIRMITREFLIDAGFAVVDVPDAASALAALQELGTQIDLLFTDIHMPGEMNGLQLARQVKRQWPRVEVLIASGNVWPKSEDLPDGSQFLKKPYMLEAMVRHVRALAG